ncbi:CAP family protein [Kitasatospora sp. NPDC001159]
MTTLPIRRIAMATAAATLATMTAMQPAMAAGASHRAFTDQTDSMFQNDCLTAINPYRAKHQAPPLTIDPKLVDYAKTRAQRISHPDGFNHNGLADGYGELLDWRSYGSKKADAAYAPHTCKDAVDSWYSESKQYNFNSPGFSDETGSFTQLVWKSTTKVGCARVGGPRNGNPQEDGFHWFDTFIACNFTPQGNFYMVGQEAQAFADNVLPAKP